MSILVSGPACPEEWIREYALDGCRFQRAGRCSAANRDRRSIGHSMICCFHLRLLATRNTHCMKQNQKAALDGHAARVASLLSTCATSNRTERNCVLSANLCPISSPSPFLRHPLYATLSLAQPCRRGMASSVRWSPSPHFCIFVPARPGIPQKVAAGQKIESREQKQ